MKDQLIQYSLRTILRLNSMLLPFSNMELRIKKLITYDRNYSALLQEWLKNFTVCLTLDTKPVVVIMTCVTTVLNQFYTKEDSMKFLQSFRWLFAWIHNVATHVCENFRSTTNQQTNKTNQPNKQPTNQPN